MRRRLPRWCLAVLSMSFAAGCSQMGGREPVASPPAVSASKPSGESLPKDIYGSWVVDPSSLPDGSISVTTALVLELRALSGASSVSLGFVGCSSFGGVVLDLDPLTWTSTTVAGVGDCGREDSFAAALLRELEGGTISYRAASDELAIEGEGLRLALQRLD